ncbi:hypothetical protein KQ302_06060 [Synechococcus sp. CS-602]|uniref:hypothetical protein n=1 Tax=Synechococcaceae TaxID=1890426 RepID=UPI000AFD2AEB|nr:MULTISPECIES: hypothetical protein [Synechococcaceae]MCT4366022.1 hypothetical protein [Candidatus Regnicoccus frigidus MAG-AL1]MCT0202905.1 hypothetical protein [Synechococcus sp. CS-603]MCT0204667.1 hypothetical protein [Synechococcus sp. CS-602]MCT0245649.1 hypothetical protein [Synechococcus sp. CS-601]MCT4367647.1 hypothetical protein [Candidatus Regnicoccus frigidus MAG-AL2]
MKNTEDFKIFWWFVLVIVIGLFLYSRQDDLISGKPTYFDSIVFIIWIGICLAPIFQEMDLFGIKLKQDIQELKKDLTHQLAILKTEVTSSIEVSSANNNQIYVNTNPEPPKDSEIPDLSAQIQDALAKLGIKAEETENLREKYAGSIETEMFEVRLAFEKLLRRHSIAFGLDSKRVSVGKLLYQLRQSDYMPKEIVIGIQEVISICNYAVHGENITNDQVYFVRQSAPSLLKALEDSLGKSL